MEQSIKKKLKIVLIAFLILLLPLSYAIAYSYAIILNDEAMESTIMYNTDDKVVVEEALIDLNIACKIIPWNSTFFMNKQMLHFKLADYEAALETSTKLLKLFDDHPYYIIQQGLIYELLGDMENANKSYEESVRKYENLLKTEEQEDYNLEFEYITSLVIAGNEQQAREVQATLKQKYPEDEIVQSMPFLSKEEYLKIITDNVIEEDN